MTPGLTCTKQHAKLPVANDKPSSFVPCWDINSKGLCTFKLQLWYLQKSVKNTLLLQHWAYHVWLFHQQTASTSTSSLRSHSRRSAT